MRVRMCGWFRWASIGHLPQVNTLTALLRVALEAPIERNSLTCLLPTTSSPPLGSLVFFVAGLALVEASSDQYRAGDPIHDDEFKAAYEHVDGSINEKVLNMLHHFKPVQSGALPEWAGVLLFTIILGCSLITYMFASGCFSLRVSRPLLLNSRLPPHPVTSLATSCSVSGRQSPGCLLLVPSDPAMCRVPQRRTSTRLGATRKGLSRPCEFACA